MIPFSGPGSQCKVSTAGGTEPRWSRDTRELFYRRGSTAMVVDAVDPCRAEPVEFYDGLEAFLWDVSPTGQFLVSVEPRPTPRLRLVLNWFEELETKVGR